jgi:hypothetical protein
MRKIVLALSIAAVALLMAAGQPMAQGRPGMMWRGSGGWGPGTPYNRMYDPKTVETISGEVTSIDRITPNKGMVGGVHMNVKTEKETVSVHLGPSWYLENQDVKIAAKDKVEVKGSRITFGGKATIIAAEVKKGDDILKLRDESGFPMWTAWRRR